MDGSEAVLFKPVRLIVSFRKIIEQTGRISDPPGSVAVTLDPVAAGNYRGKGSFGWGGAGGTESWADPENELVAVRMLQQERGGNFAKAIQQAIIE